MSQSEMKNPGNRNLLRDIKNSCKTLDLDPPRLSIISSHLMSVLPWLLLKVYLRLAERQTLAPSLIPIIIGDSVYVFHVFHQVLAPSD